MSSEVGEVDEHREDAARERPPEHRQRPGDPDERDDEHLSGHRAQCAPEDRESGRAGRRASPSCVRAASAGAQGAFRSTMRQRSRTGHRSCFGFWAWHSARPWWMSRTWAAYISSGSRIPRNRSCAWSAVAFSRDQPDPLGHALHVAVHRHHRHPEAEREHDRRRLLADPVDGRQPVARLERRHVAEELEAVVAALLADVAERRLEARRLLRARGRPGRMTSISWGSGAFSTAVQSGGGAVDRPSPPQPMPGPVLLGRPVAGVRAPQRLVRLLGVHVRGVLGEDREDQLARGVQAGLPPLLAVLAGEAVEDVPLEARPVAAQVARPLLGGIGGLARPLLRLRCSSTRASPIPDVVWGLTGWSPRRAPARSDHA